MLSLNFYQYHRSMKPSISLFLFLAGCFISSAQELKTLYGAVRNSQGQALSGIRLSLLKQGQENTEQPRETFTNAMGAYRYEKIESGFYILNIEHTGYKSIKQLVNLSSAGSPAAIDLTLSPVKEQLIGEVIKEAKKPTPSIAEMNRLKPVNFTRLPVEISYMPQSVSVVDHRLIAQQGGTDLDQSLQNVPGIYSFSTFGNTARSSGARGFGGITYMMNNIPFIMGKRSSSTLLPDMEGIEQLEVIRGAAAIQYGNVGAGGIINLKPKLPKFSSGGYVSLRGGSWNLFRPSFDLYGPLNYKKTLAYRMVGIYERSDSFRKYVKGEKIYINPSLEWKPSDNTSLIFQYLYMNDERTPDRGTIFYQKDKSDPGKIHDLPFDRFIGFKNDRQKIINQIFSLNVSHKFDDHFTLKAGFNHVDETRDFYGLMNHPSYQPRPSSLPMELRGRPVDHFTEKINRTLTKETDRYSRNWVQMDLFATALYTGAVRHDLQVGTDFSSRMHKKDQYHPEYIDQLDVVSGPINNNSTLPELKKSTFTKSDHLRFGVNLHDLITIDKRWRLTMGLRYTTESNSQTETTYLNRRGIILATPEIKKNPKTTAGGFSPSFGVIYSPVANLNLYASYTNTFDPTTYRNKKDQSLGNNVINQVETGIKSTWFEDALLFNLSLYKIFNPNQIIKITEQSLSYYERAGSTLSQGIEMELRAQPVRYLDIIGGFTYQQARYKKSDYYVDNSETFNVPRHIANIWVHYTLASGIFKNLSLGVGAYYMGERSANDTFKIKHPGGVGSPDEVPIKLPNYTIINASLGYQYKKIRVSFYANNLWDQRAYTAYRSFYINPIDPRNYSLALQYHF